MPSLSQNLSDTAIIEALDNYGLGGSCPLVEGEYESREARVFRVTFIDRPSVCVRILSARHHGEKAIRQVDEDRQIYEKLESSGFAWSSRIVGASLTFDNPIGSPFLLLEFAEGIRLEWTEASPPQPERDMLLLHLADIQEELLRCTWETRDETAQQYYERKIKRQLKQVQEGKLAGVAEQDVRDQLALLPEILGDQKDCREFALEHGDLRPENIIVSEQCRIIGIIDWGFAEMVPVIQAARMPRFLFSSESAAELPSDDMLKDRGIYEISYSSQDSPAARAMKRAQTGADVDFRTLYLESIKDTGMLKSMASIGWKLPRSDEDRD